MDVTSLVEGALDEAGLALALVLHPERGERAILGHVNGTLARMLGQPQPSLQGLKLSVLRQWVGSATQWSALEDALVAGTPRDLDLGLSAGTAETWLGLRLTFPPHEPGGAAYAVLTGRDITAKRRAAQQEAHSQRLLASIFLGIAVPVAIVGPGGEIIMGNPALQNLLGYDPKELVGLRVQDLTSAQDAGRAQAARVRQLDDGKRYDMRMSVLAKGHVDIPVHLTSILFQDGDQRLRVVTFLPDTTDQAAILGRALPVARDKGELQAVSLAAFRVAFGDDWERIAIRAMMKAERIIRRRLNANDIINRVDDHNFVVWFDSPDRDHNAQVLSRAVREIRLRFLTDFGGEATAHVNPAMEPGQGVSPEAAPMAQLLPTGHEFVDLLRARRPQE